MTLGGRQRRSRGITYRRRILIIGDGKTEENYFDGLTCTNPNILIRSYGAGKTGLGHILKKARMHMDSLGININDGDRVALVMDLDLIYSVEDVIRMENECRKRGIELYVSNPCFEVWLLLHFRRFDRPSNPKDLIVFMSEVLGGEYVKSKLLEWDEDKVRRAITNANSIYGEHFTNKNCAERNPSTTVYQLVKGLL